MITYHRLSGEKAIATSIDYSKVEWQKVKIIMNVDLLEVKCQNVEKE